MSVGAPPGRPCLVPELVVTELDRSLAFWRDLIGFRIRHARPEELFAYLELGGAEVMLEGRDPRGRQWLMAPFAPPLGVGLNLQIAVPDVAAIVARLRPAGWPLVVEPEDKWCRTGDHDTGQRQFAVADPDGHLLRPYQDLGSRPL